MCENEGKNKLKEDDLEKGREINMARKKKKYDPWKPFPEDVTIKIPESSPTFSMKEVDKSIKKMMKKISGR